MKKPRIIIFIASLVFFLFSASAYSENDTSAPETSDDAGFETSGGDVSLQELREELKLLNEKIIRLQEENEIRRKLELTEEETYDKESDILDSADRKYTLLRSGVLGFDYSFSYSAYSYDILFSDPNRVEYASSHSLSNAFTFQRAVKDNITASVNIPFLTKIDSQSNLSTKYITDLGDIGFGLQYQPIQSGGDIPAPIISLGISCPTGRSPYEINREHELSTGSGMYSMSLGANISKTIDPLVAFGSLSLGYPLGVDGLDFKNDPSYGEKGYWLTEVDPGMSVSMGMGIGFSLSYKVSMSANFTYSYSFSSEYSYSNGDTYKSEDANSATLGLGTGWRLSPKRSVNISLGLGLSKNASDYTLGVRVPFQFEL